MFIEVSSYIEAVKLQCSVYGINGTAKFLFFITGISRDTPYPRFALTDFKKGGNLGFASL